MTEPVQNNERRHCLVISELLKEIAGVALDNKNKGADAFESALNEYSQDLAERIVQLIPQNTREENDCEK